MRSATSYFKISTAVIKDDFRRFWAVPAIAFVFYFFSTIFYILMNLDTIDEQYSGMARFVESVLSGEYFPNIFNIIWLSMLSVLLVFRYLHNSGHTIAVHSQPFTRAALINSHMVSCILFIALPILVTGIILLIVAQPCYYPQQYYDSADEMINVFARIDIVRWMWESLLTGLFIMVISIAAGMVTGTSFHHAVAALGFNAVVPLCILLATLYGDMYLFGYTQPVWLETVIKHTTPLVALAESTFMSVGMYVYFIILIVLIYVLAMFLYYKRKLEKATDGIVFKAVDVLITFIFGYLGMTGLGMTFYSMFDRSAGATAVGYIAGALLGMVIVRMVILKSIKIFNKKTMIITGSYLVAALVFFGCLSFDVTGYESRIPDTADEAYISLSSGFRSDLTDGGSYSEKETIDAVKAFNRFIVENKDICEEVSENNWKNDNSFYEDMIILNIDYFKKNGDSKKVIYQRQYRVPVYLIAQSQEFKDLFANDEIVDKFIERLPGAKEISYIDIYSGRYDQASPYGVASENDEVKGLCADKTKIAGLMEALEKDYRTMTGEDIVNDYNLPIMGRLSIFYNSKAAENGGNDENAAIINDMNHMNDDDMTVEVMTAANGDESSLNIVSDYDSSFEIQFTRTYKNTINWLNQNGYGDLIKLDESYWDFATVCELENGNFVAEDYNEDGESLENIPESRSGVTVVTDPAKICLLYQNACSHVVYGARETLSTDEDNVYYVELWRDVAYGDNNVEYTCDYSAYVKGQYLS